MGCGSMYVLVIQMIFPNKFVIFIKKCGIIIARCLNIVIHRIICHEKIVNKIK